jgi:UDPglucose 6-dehydrogenase/GDP-mannose 6-dehydrogenase
MLGLLARDFPSLAGVETTVLGLAFKEGTDDVREATALPIVRELVAQGARVTAYDPIAMRAAQPLLPAGVRYAPSLRDAVANAQAILVCTRWHEFEELAPLVAERDPPPLVVDGRRMLSREKFRRYAGIGL